jgi:hypothetical protein
MKPCKEKLPDGKPCPNQADEGQEYCPFHLANQDKKMKDILLPIGGAMVSVAVAGIGFVIKEALASFSSKKQ